MSKRKYAIVVLLTIIVIIIFTVIIISNTRTRKKSLADRDEGNIVHYTRIEKIGLKDDEVEQTSKVDNKITPNTFIKFVKYYKKCGHTVTSIENIPREFINKNIEEIQEKYNDWIIEEANNKQITLYKEFDEECGEHYLVKDNNGYITIYTIDSDGKETLVEPTEIYIRYLPEIDKEKLKNGVKLNGKEELNAYIEDFE